MVEPASAASGVETTAPASLWAVGRRTSSRAFKVKFGLLVVLLFVFVNLPLYQSLTESDPDLRIGTTGVVVILAIDAVLLLVVLAIVRPGHREAEPTRRFEALSDVEPVEGEDADWDAARVGAIAEATDEGYLTLVGEVLETTDDEVTVGLGALRVVVVLDQFVNPVPAGHAARVRGRWL